MRVHVSRELDGIRKGRRDYDAPSQLFLAQKELRPFRRRTAAWCRSGHGRTLVLRIRNTIRIGIERWRRQRCRDDALLRSGIGTPIGTAAGHCIRAI